jgi:hypothetical protein
MQTDYFCGQTLSKQADRRAANIQAGRLLLGGESIFRQADYFQAGRQTTSRMTDSIQSGRLLPVGQPIFMQADYLQADKLPPGRQTTSKDRKIGRKTTSGGQKEYSQAGKLLKLSRLPPLRQTSPGWQITVYKGRQTK